MTQDKDQMRAEFDEWFCSELGLPMDADTTMYDEAFLTFRAWQAARASAPHGVPEPGWWRKRADEIELQVAKTGSREAMSCYTDMRGLLQAAAAPQPVALSKG